MANNLESPNENVYDVVIVGGAIYGSSIAWFLSKNSDFDGSILVIEKDPTYKFASTSLTNSCIRQQFSQKINILISQFGAKFIKTFHKQMEHDQNFPKLQIPKLQIKNFGYMYLANNENVASQLLKSQQMQSKYGVKTKHLKKEEIKTDYPFYNTTDIIAGNINLFDEGYFDSNTLFEKWKRSAKQLGTEFIENEVIDITLSRKKNKVESVTLKSGNEIFCHKLINASGPRAALVASLADIKVPVEPRKRYSFIFEAKNRIDQDIPLTIDPSGIHIRSDGDYYLAGCPPDDDIPVEYDDFYLDHSIWETKIWPIIANRIPQFDSVRLINSWVGHYAFNTFDQNAILGPHSTVDNFIFVNGFSGHGLQQSPAVGRGISELVTYNKYKTLDLSPLGFSRIEQKKPLLERAII